MPNAQEYLNKEYPKDGKCLGEFDPENKDKTRAEITKLNFNEKNLTGPLNLNDFVNLTRLDCWKNKLTSLDISNCEKLAGLRAENNQLTNDTLLLSKKASELTFLNTI